MRPPGGSRALDSESPAPGGGYRDCGPPGAAGPAQPECCLPVPRQGPQVDTGRCNVCQCQDTPPVLVTWDSVGLRGGPAACAPAPGPGRHQAASLSASEPDSEPVTIGRAA